MAAESAAKALAGLQPVAIWFTLNMVSAKQLPHMLYTIDMGCIEANKRTIRAYRMQPTSSSAR
eukprot:5448168-Amphidinium_carterae.1